MSDQHTLVGELRGLVRAFVAEREWEAFHNPKDLAISIAIEAAELMEIFQWRDRGEPLEGRTLQHFREELADVLIYCLATANATGIDLSDAIMEKVRKNALKYDRHEYRGRHTLGE